MQTYNFPRGSPLVAFAILVLYYMIFNKNEWELLVVAFTFGFDYYMIPSNSFYEF